MEKRATQQRLAAERLSARLPALLVEAERVATTVAQGVHGRRRVGMGDAFWQFRNYHTGDSITRIDWRASAKSDRVYVRENEWDAAQTVWIWVDPSPSMAWRSRFSNEDKIDRARLLALALAALLLKAGERVGLLGPGGRMRAHAGRFALMRLHEEMMLLPPGDSLPPQTGLPRFSELVLLSDVLSPMEGWQRRLRAYAGLGVRGHLLQLLDPAEETLPYDGRVRFDGLEGEAPQTFERVESLRMSWRDLMAARRATLATLAGEAGWRFGCHHTDASARQGLLALYAGLGGLGRLPGLS